ncbi:MAG: ATP-dependent DNA helicase RecG [Eubacteriales bacterium]|nr:ATP-dependent DNA helicase RecG [Eubacteriales bacterium]
MKLTDIKGIGEKTAGAMGRLGIFDGNDLIRTYPRTYETYGSPSPVFSLRPGTIGVVEGELVKDAVLNRFNGLTIVNVYLSDMTGRLQISWFNLPYIKNYLKAGMRFVFRGRIYEKNGRMVMNQPKMYSPADYREKFEGHLIPVYPLGKGVTNTLMVKCVGEALKEAADCEFLSDDILSAYALMGEREALIRIHFPTDPEELAKARKRLAFDDFFLFLLAGKELKKAVGKTASEFRCRPDFRMLHFIAGLPFELTKAQADAYKAIAHDMSSGNVMNRLVEGDVGSGKTIVAVLSMMYAAFNGYQAAMMAPTEVLARQHAEIIQKYFAEGNIDLTVTLLTGSMTAAEKKIACDAIREHKADIVIGTHALFQDKVEYDKLGLVVTDEQHRFGVGQREALSRKGGIPHVLIMSATPIPRTLAIMLYGDLDISIIDVLPSGRLPIKNCVVDTGYRDRAYKFILNEIKKGHQAYVICPSIEKDPEDEMTGGSDLENVLDYTASLKKIMPENVAVASLHGRMKPQEKDNVMTEFKEGKIQVLVSTTVVEVGVDVPNATVMMIENAERFGLAQLHQLRGRVGRGTDQSYCIMVNTSGSEKAAERLDILNKSNDGFHIAEEDLRMRGPGDLFGVRQSGELLFDLADVYSDADVLKLAKEATERLSSEDPELENAGHAKIRDRLDKYMDRRYTV